MKQAAILSASEVLRMLASTSKAMEETTNPFELEKRWGEALTFIQRIYNRFESGVSKSKSSDETKAWSKAILQTRDSDPLLRYLIAARHDAEHGLPLGSEVGVNFYMKQTVLKYYAALKEPRPDWIIFATNHPDTTLSAPAIRLKPAVSRAPRKKGRVSSEHSSLIYPPLEHLGKPTFSVEPVVIIKLALTYFSQLLDEAKRLPLHS